MGLKQKIQSDMKIAMRAKDSVRLGVIRLINAAIKQREIDDRIVLGDEQVQVIIQKMIKQRKDSVNQFEAGGRQDLADIEKAEIEIISGYMPEALSEDQIQVEIMAAISACDAKGAADMGKVMAILKPCLSGRADMTKVAACVKDFLAS